MCNMLFIPPCKNVNSINRLNSIHANSINRPYAPLYGYIHISNIKILMISLAVKYRRLKY